MNYINSVSVRTPFDVSRVKLSLQWTSRTRAYHTKHLSYKNRSRVLKGRIKWNKLNCIYRWNIVHIVSIRAQNYAGKLTIWMYIWYLPNIPRVRSIHPYIVMDRGTQVFLKLRVYFGICNRLISNLKPNEILILLT